jgi:hypothetical protein
VECGIVSLVEKQVAARFSVLDFGTTVTARNLFMIWNTKLIVGKTEETRFFFCTNRCRRDRERCVRFWDCRGKWFRPATHIFWDFSGRIFSSRM